MDTYLCHKCSGALSASAAAVYGCNCISGYIRDWQKPMPEAEVRTVQREALEQRIALYARQDREPHFAPLVAAKAALAKLTGG